MKFSKNKKESLLLGIDVGSTTVKMVVTESSGKILWKKYRRHNARQPELVFEFLKEIEKDFPGRSFIPFITGSGGRCMAPLIKAHYIQEVNAVSLAVENLYPDVSSVIELGGQDAKVILWKGNKKGRRSIQTFMNDKCAGGTGATIDRILEKIGLSHEKASKISVKDRTVHHIAAKCGVFAETDVVGLMKAGVKKEDIFISLCTAVVKQNLEVLVRGNVLRDRVMLLGGPHTYMPALKDIWRSKIPKIWKLHDYLPTVKDKEKSIFVPSDSQYFAAMGAVLVGRKNQELSGEKFFLRTHIYRGTEELEDYIKSGRIKHLETFGAVTNGLVKSENEIAEFSEKYSVPEFSPPEIKRNSRLETFLGIDGGSTSTKLMLLDSEGKPLYCDYTLSSGNPIDDLLEMFLKMKKWSEEKGLIIEFLGTAVTGYASSILKTAFNFDRQVVETVAHMRSAVSCYGDVDIICDVGGQDIKVLFMKHGRVVDFKLNTQCSAGNGYFLQSMASQFGVDIEDYADFAFRARKAPVFNYGCAVFMEQDKVNFQQLGWNKEEIMAGLALVLPKNIWNYVVQESNIERLGSRIVLQGGTQKNPAAVKAQVDYLNEKINEAEIHVHKYSDISGAMGAAMEIMENPVDKSSFIGIENACGISFFSRNDAETRCSFCSNRCPRTFVDIKVPETGTVRYISGYHCEKGAVETIVDIKDLKRKKNKLKKDVPNLADESAELVFSEFSFSEIPANRTSVNRKQLYPTSLRKHPSGVFKSSSAREIKKRKEITVGIPRLLNMYLYNPFFSTYLRTLGIKVIYSDYTSKKLWEEGNNWGAIDPCFPAKVAPAHIYNIIKKGEVSHILFPMITHLHSAVENTIGNNACVIQMGTPEVVDAVFTRDNNYFSEHGILYLKPLISMDNKVEMTHRMYEYFSKVFPVTEDENAWAVREGQRAMNSYFSHLREKGRKILNNCVVNNKMAILVIGHPYHHDLGLNHGITEEFQKRGFPILTIESLPADGEFTGNLFSGNENPKDITDVWQRNFNRNTNLKIWASKIAARHPNIAVIDFSSFKCGHDAPTYSYIDRILDESETPHFLFHDLDQNKPGATFDIRIQTIEYFLRLEEKKLSLKSGAS